MAKFQDSSGVACCLDWSRQGVAASPLTLTPVKAIYLKDSKKYSSCDLYDNALKSCQVKDYVTCKVKSNFDVSKKCASNLCLVKQSPCTLNGSVNNSQSKENANHCSINTRNCFDISCYNEPRYRTASPCSIWSGKLTNYRDKSKTNCRSFSKPRRRDKEIIPVMKEPSLDQCFDYKIKSQNTRSRSNNCANNLGKKLERPESKNKEKSKLKTVNSYTLIKQNYKKHNEEYYNALDKVSNFYSECTTENEICISLLKYFSDRCRSNEKKNVNNDCLPGTKPRCCSLKYEDARVPKAKLKVEETSVSEESLSDSTNFNSTKNRVYKNLKLNDVNEESAKINNKNQKIQAECSCKCIKLCDIICHKCQTKLLKNQ